MARRRPSPALPATPGPARWLRRRWLLATLATLTVGAAVTIPAIPALADSFQFVSVGGDGSGDLSITVSSDYQLTDWSIQLTDGTNTYTIDDFTDFTDTTAGGFVADQNQTYVLNPAAPDNPLAGIEPGTYSATAEAATDSNPDPTSNTLAAPETFASGTFNYVAQPTVTLANSTFTTTQPIQPVTIGGTLGCSTLSCPAGGWPIGTPVTITDQTSPSQPTFSGATTDAAGDFSVQNVIGVPGDQYNASVAAVTGVSFAASSPTSTTDDPSYTAPAIIATASPAPYGLQSITGKLAYQAAGSFNWTGVAGVVITATAAGHSSVSSKPTAADGSFSLLLPGATGTTQWQLSNPNDDLTSTPFLSQAETPLDASQLWPTAITGFYARVNKEMDLTVGGCLATSISPAPKDNPTVEIDYRPGRTGAWHAVGTVPSMTEPGCTGVVFSGGGAAKGPSEHYRASFAGDSAYEAATGPSVFAGLTQVRYYGFTVSPRTVQAGKRIKISGKLQYLSGKTWRAYSGQSVLIAYSKHAGNLVWYEWPGGQVRTSKTGAFSLTLADTVGTQYWSADYSGNKTHYAQWASTIKVTVRGHVRAARAAIAAPPVRILRPEAGGRWPFELVAQPLVALLSA